MLSNVPHSNINHHPADTAEGPLSQLADRWFPLCPFGMALLHLDGRFIRANAAFSRLLGYEEQLLRHLNIQALLHPDELLRSMHLLSELAAGAAPSFAAELRWIHDTGELLWCSTHVSLVRDEPTASFYFLLHMQDQTEKTMLAGKLHHSIQTCHTLIESVPYSLFMIDIDWRLTFLNRAAEKTFKDKKEHLLGQNLWQRFPRALQSAFYAPVCRAMEEKTPVYHHAFYAPRGRWYEMTAHPTKDGLCLFFRDTTELKRQESAYQETKLLLDSAIGHSSDPISILDVNHRIVQINPAYLAAFGFTEEELLWQAHLNIPKELLDETQELYRQASAGHHVKDYETKRRHKDGRLLDVRLTLSPVTSTEQTVVALFHIIRDIRESGGTVQH